MRSGFLLSPSPLFSPLLPPHLPSRGRHLGAFFQEVDHADGCLLLLLEREEFGASPLRVDDELERIELLILLPQPVKCLPAQVHQSLARRVGAEPEVSELERERMIAPLQQALSATDEGLLLPPAEEIEGRRPLLGGEHLHPFAMRLPVARALLVDPCDQLVSH